MTPSQQLQATTRAVQIEAEEQAQAPKEHPRGACAMDCDQKLHSTLGWVLGSRQQTDKKPSRAGQSSKVHRCHLAMHRLC